MKIHLMNMLKPLVFLLAISNVAHAQEDYVSISLNDLSAFRDAGKNWVIAGDAIADYTREHNLRAVKGQGVLVNNFSRNQQMHLFTKEEFGDIEIDLEFMMAKSSNSGVYLQGRYEIQLLDSWMRTDPTSSDAGGVYSRWTAQRGTFEGTPPVMNVAKAPGLWQHLNIRFRAPQFNDKGEKIKNARFETVYLNGVLVQQEVEVTGGTGSNMFPDAAEVAKGPLVLQGDHGPVAFRNIRYKNIPKPVEGPERDEYWIPKSNYWNTVDPIIVEAEGKPAFIKTFLMYGDKKLTHVLSVGNPDQVNYSYNLKQGEIFQVWRGQFIDVTPSWRDRGGMQIAVPLGSVISLSNEPAVAVLAGPDAKWPAAVAFDSMHNKGYTLDKNRTPVFEYSVYGLNVSDSISTVSEGISRTISVGNPADNLYCRLASGKQIQALGNNLFAVGDKSYYIKVDKKYKPVVRQVGDNFEILVKYNSPITYSLIW